MKSVLASRATFAIGMILGREVARRIRVQRDRRRASASLCRLLHAIDRANRVITRHVADRAAEARP